VTHALEIERLRGERQPEPAARGPGLLVWAVVAVILLGAGAALYHPPYVVIAPGETADIGRDITVSGTATTPLTGRYLLTSVRLERASGLGTLLAALRTDRDVVPVGRVLPKGVDPREYAESQQKVFQRAGAWPRPPPPARPACRCGSAAAGSGWWRCCPTRRPPACSGPATSS
jgi:hypothetical protein